jgi:hypothetical protein
MIAFAITIQFSYVNVPIQVKREIYLVTFLLTFLVTFCLANIFKPKIRLSLYERLLLILGLIFSLAVVYVIL